MTFACPRYLNEADISVDYEQTAAAIFALLTEAATRHDRKRRSGPIPGQRLRVDYALVAEAARNAPPGCTAAAVAEATGCSLHTARTRIERARLWGFEIPESNWNPRKRKPPKPVKPPYVPPVPTVPAVVYRIKPEPTVLVCACGHVVEIDHYDDLFAHVMRNHDRRPSVDERTPKPRPTEAIAS